MTLMFFLTTALFFLVAASQPPPPPPPPPPSGCTDELVSLSPCLGYISLPPNNITEDVTSQCCDAFYSGDRICLCYLLRQPMIFGFPLNESRLLSLSSVCSLKNASLATWSGSLDSFCSVSPALPPLHSNIGSGTSKPSDSGHDNASSPSMGLSPGSVRSSPTSLNLPPDSAVRSAGPPTSSVEPARGSPATKLVYNSTSWFLTGALILLIFFHM